MTLSILGELSLSTPISGWFPIVSAKNNKTVGELEIDVQLEPVADFGSRSRTSLMVDSDSSSVNASEAERVPNPTSATATTGENYRILFKKQAF